MLSGTSGRRSTASSHPGRRSGSKQRTCTNYRASGSGGAAPPDPDIDDPVAEVPDAPHLGPEARALDREFERTLQDALGELPVDW